MIRLSPAFLTDRKKAHIRQEVKVSTHVPINHCIAPHLFVTRSGALGATIHAQGLPVDVTGDRDITLCQNQWAFALKLAAQFSITVTTHRHPANAALDGNYPLGFAQDFSQAYQKKFQNSPLFVNDIYLTLLLKASPIARHKNWMHAWKIQSANETALQQAEQIRLLQQAITTWFERLVDYKPTLLSFQKKSDQGVTSDLLGFFSVLVNGESQPMTFPEQDFATLLPQKRLFFGRRVIHYEGATRTDDRFAAILSIKTYAHQTHPGLLNGLLGLPFSMIQTHSFQGIEKTAALEAIRRQGAHLGFVGDAALSQRDELPIAADDIASDRIQLGYHHHTLLILSPDLAQLENHVAKATKIYADVGIVAIRETLNLENAFWAQMPGNMAYIHRKSLISHQNFSGFCSLHNAPAGYLNCNHLGSAMMIAQTRYLTPFYLNLHEQASGRPDDLPKAHTTLIGASNAGKTVLLLTLNTLLQKYRIRSFIFDRNRGCEIYVRAMGGIYHPLTPQTSTGWNPCQLEDIPSNREFLRDFIAVLASQPGNKPTSADESQIADAVDRTYALPFEDRHLSHLSSFFRLDFSGLTALAKWLRLPDRTGRSGEYAWIFDNPTDTLNVDHDTLGFDLTAFLGDEQIQSKDRVTPVMMYLFKRIESALDGRLTGVYLDEGWQFLHHHYWVQKLKSYFFTWRKLNAFIFFATQLPDLIAESPLASTLIQGAATTIFLPNPKADAKDYIEGFKLTTKEFAFIKDTPIDTRYFLFKQGHTSAILRLNLQGMEHFLSVLSGNQHTLPLCDKARAEHGEDPKDWLPAFYAQVKST
jgi:type IV secretion system protein VirB4